MFQFHSSWLAAVGAVALLAGCPGTRVEPDTPSPSPSESSDVGGLYEACVGGVLCNGALVCVDGICIEPGVAGSVCFVDGTCDDGLLCVDDACVAEGEAPDDRMSDAGVDDLPVVPGSDGGIDDDDAGVDDVLPPDVVDEGRRLQPLNAQGGAVLESANGRLRGTFILTPVAPVDLDGTSLRFTAAPLR